DDATLLTCQKDAGGAEVVLRDCPPDRPLGVELPPLQFCSRGADRCALGDARAEVLKHRKLDAAEVPADGPVALGQPAPSPYHVVLVWFEGAKVGRVVARHRAKPGSEPAKTGEA